MSQEVIISVLIGFSVGTLIQRLVYQIADARKALLQEKAEKNRLEDGSNNN